MKQLKQEILEHAKSLQDQEQGYFHHENCPASNGQRDHKPRLWVKRDGYNVAFYCQHCSEHGNVYQGYVRKTFLEDEVRGISTSSTTGSRDSGKAGKSYRIPTDTSTDITKWPREARIWVLQYGITEDELSSLRIGYSDYVHRIILPVYTSDGLAGFQTRRVHTWDTKPKYKTYRNVRDMYFKYCLLGTSTAVVTEDLLSAVKCSRYLDSFALLGSTASDKLMQELIQYNQVLIFMDDDNSDIKRKQLKLKKRLELFTDVKLITGIGKDPKECTDTELQEIFNAEV